MNYQEALSMLQKHKSLEGKKANNKVIERLLIVPINHEELGTLISNAERRKSNEVILSKYDDFDVLVVFEGDRTGPFFILEKQSLGVVLESMRNQI
jgi:hypothetical protein